MQAPDTPYENATPLAVAVWRDQPDKVRKLLRDGADVNQRGGDEFGKGGSSGAAPIHLAISKARPSKTFETLPQFQHW